jgi:hypothetical protein
MTITWIPEQQIWEEAELVAPESMGGMGYSRRYTASEKIDGLFALVTVGFYNNDRRGAYGSDDPDVSPLDDTIPAEERYCIGQHIEFMLCRDPEDPGSTEEWCDYRYVDSWFARGEKFTDEQIKALMEKFEAKWIYWQGNRSSDLNAQSTWAEPTRREDWDGGDGGVGILTDELKAVVTEILAKRDRSIEEGV